MANKAAQDRQNEQAAIDAGYWISKISGIYSVGRGHGAGIKLAGFQSTKRADARKAMVAWYLRETTTKPTEG